MVNNVDFLIEDYTDRELKDISSRPGDYSCCADILVVSHKEIVEALNEIIGEHSDMQLVMAVDLFDLPYVTEYSINCTRVVKEACESLTAMEYMLGQFVYDEDSPYFCEGGGYSWETTVKASGSGALRIELNSPSSEHEFALHLSGETMYSLGERGSTEYVVVEARFYYAPKDMIIPMNMRPQAFNALKLTPVTITKGQLAAVLLSVPSDRVFRSE